ncbi:MAG: prolyl oligopeptidase family serine peptidase, partial [Gammaproteobacteria bacterium]
MRYLVYITLLIIFNFAADNQHSVQASTKKLPVQTFFKNEDISNLRISPDGKHYAATVVVEDDKKLAVLDAKTKKIKALFDFSTESREIGQIGWFNNERVYATMVQKVGPLDTPRPTGFLFAGNIDGTQKKQLLPRPKRPGKGADRPRAYRFLSFLPKDDKNIMIGMNEGSRQTAFKMNVYTGFRKRLEKSPMKYGSLAVDHNGDVRVSTAVELDEEKFVIHTKKNADSDWELFKSFDSKDVGMTPIGFNRDNSKLYMNVTQEGSKRGIYTLDMNTSDLDMVYAIEGDADIERYIWDDGFYAREVIGVQRMPGYVEDEFFDKNNRIAQLHINLANAFPEQQVDIVNFVSDGSQALVYVWSDRNPGTYYLYDLKNNQMEFLLNVRSWIDRKAMAKTSPVSFEARDGVEIRGYLTLPNGKDKDLPLVLYIHGGPYGVKDEWGFNFSNRSSQFLANRGYAVLQVNYRGSGGRGSKFIYDNYLKVGSEMQDDVTDATLWAIKEGIADKDRVCIYGASYGGYAALMGVVKEPDLYKCAIPYVGVYDITIQKESDTYRSEYGRKFLDEAWGFSDEAFVRERSPIYHLDKLKAALFFVHGNKDLRVPIDQYDAVTAKLDQMGYPYESMVKQHEGHGFRDEDNQYELYTKIEAFLNKHIGN